MTRHSFRVRLTLWNVAILALVLTGSGLTLCCSVQNWTSWSIDRELAERGHQSARHATRLSRMPPPGTAGLQVFRPGGGTLGWSGPAPPVRPGLRGGARDDVQGRPG